MKKIINADDIEAIGKVLNGHKKILNSSVKFVRKYEFWGFMSTHDQCINISKMYPHVAAIHSPIVATVDSPMMSDLDQIAHLAP